MEVSKYAASQKILAMMEARREWEAWLALGRMKQQETMRAEAREELYEKLGLPGEKAQVHRLLDTIVATMNALKRVPPGLREVIGQAVRAVLGAVTEGGDLGEANKAADGILAFAQQAAAKGEEARGMIAQLRSVTKAVAGPAAALLAGMADNAETVLNRATSLGELDGLKSFLESALLIGRKLMNMQPGSAEYAAAMAELGGLAVQLDGLSGRKRAPGDATEVQAGELALDQEALDAQQLERIALEAEQLTQQQG